MAIYYKHRYTPDDYTGRHNFFLFNLIYKLCVRNIYNIIVYFDAEQTRCDTSVRRKPSRAAGVGARVF